MRTKTEQHDAAVAGRYPKRGRPPRPVPVGPQFPAAHQQVLVGVTREDVHVARGAPIALAGGSDHVERLAAHEERRGVFLHAKRRGIARVDIHPNQTARNEELFGIQTANGIANR